MATTEPEEKPDRSKTIEVRDWVTVGDNVLTWQVISINENGGKPYAICESGQSGRQVGWFVEHLRLWKKAPENG